MSEGRVRLFVALELPTAAREALVRWRDEAFLGVEGLRLLDPEHLHVTLCFLGWRDAAEVTAIAGACAAAAKASPGPAELELEPPVWLPPRRPRVLALTLLDPAHAVTACQAALSGELERGGWYTPEGRPFRPHVTVARVSRGARAPAIELRPPPALRFSPPAVTLFRSRLAPSGARYEALVRLTPTGSGSTAS